MDPDAEVMLRLREGDDLALNELMSRWQKPLVSFLYRYTGSEEEALDLAQETFVRVFQKRSGYRVKGKFSTWLFAIAANLARNYLRWQRRHPALALDAPGEEGATLAERVPGGGDAPDRAAARNDLAVAVRRAVQELPHPLKTVVILFEYEDLGYADIARVMHCSSKAVETRLYRARQILREKLEPLTRA